MKQLFLPDHNIQIDILNGLRYAPTVRFSDLKPKRIESNLFMYHLRQLTKAGFVTKTDEGYTLTGKGKTFMSKSSAQDLRYRVQPTILSVLCIHDPESGQWLVTKRLHQPFIDVIGFPSGKIHEGETFAEAAQREALEKLHIDSISLTQKGVFEVRYWQDDIVSRHIVGIVSIGSAKLDADFLYKTTDFSSYWADESVLAGERVFAEHDALLALIKRPGLFIESFDE